MVTTKRVKYGDIVFKIKLLKKPSTTSQDAQPPSITHRIAQTFHLSVLAHFHIICQSLTIKQTKPNKTHNPRLDAGHACVCICTHLKNHNGVFDVSPARDCCVDCTGRRRVSMRSQTQSLRPLPMRHQTVPSSLPRPKRTTRATMTSTTLSRTTPRTTMLWCWRWWRRSHLRCPRYDGAMPLKHYCLLHYYYYWYWCYYYCCLSCGAR